MIGNGGIRIKVTSLTHDVVIEYLWCHDDFIAELVLVMMR